MAGNQTSDGTNFRQDVQGLRGGIDTLKADVGTVAHAAATAVRSGATELQHEAQHAVAAATESSRSAVVRNPLASLGVAAGVGIIIGVLISHRRN